MARTKLLDLYQRPGWQKVTTIQDLRKENEEMKKETEYLRKRFDSISEKKKQLEERCEEIKKTIATLREE